MQRAAGPAVLCSAHPIATTAPVEPVRLAPRSAPATTAPPTVATAAPTSATAPEPAPATPAAPLAPSPEPAPATATATPEPTEVSLAATDRPAAGANATVDTEPAPEPEPVAPPPPPTTVPARTAKVGGSLAAAVVTLANAERAKAGLGALAVDARLTAAANAHSADQAATNRMDHTGSDGSTMADRVNASGYRWRALGENVAVGYQDAASVMTGWMKSAGHRKNILTPGFTAIGVAVAAAGDGTYYWTMDLGTGG